MHFECDEWDIVGYPGEFVYGDEMYVSDYYMDERWLPIHSFPGYWVSNKARVYGSSKNSHRRPHILATQKDRCGHEYVVLYLDNKLYRRFVHHLMAEAFISNPKNFPLVRHLNDIPDDNEMDNLAWGTKWDNMQDSIRNGTALCLRQQIPVKAIDLVTGDEYEFKSQAEAARQLGLDATNIRNVLSGRYHQTRGYTFERLDGVSKSRTIGASRMRYAKIKAINLNTGKSYIFDSQADAAECLGIGSRLINNVLRKRRSQTHGYSFEYVLER